MKLGKANPKSESKKGRSDLPLTKELRMDMARLEIPVSGWTCLRTVKDASVNVINAIC